MKRIYNILAIILEVTYVTVKEHKAKLIVDM
jgi:hypothetical protein